MLAFTERKEQMKKRFFRIGILLIPLVLTSCSMDNKSSDYGYLNNHYNLVRCGDIHGANIYDITILDQYEAYDDYKGLFDINNSFLNFQCRGTSYDDFWCEGSIKLVDNKGVVLIDNKSFSCWTDATLYYGKIYYEDEQDKNVIGNIYVFAPYWCRIQLDYDVSGEGDIKTITFEYWIGSFNDLPDFLKGNYGNV